MHPDRFGAEGNGLYVGRADGDGVNIQSAGNWGVTVASAAYYGVYVGSTGYAGLVINSAGERGVAVTGADDDGVYANTTQTNHEWGLYTPDKIYVGSTLASGGPLMLVDQSGDANNLETGDVVTVSGAGTVVDEGEAPIKVGETTFYAPGTVIGQAMGALEPAQGDGLIWALVLPK